MKASVQHLSGPDAEPVTLADAKLSAKVDGSDQDALISGLIVAARRQAEHETGRLFGEQTWRVELVDWPAPTDELPVNGPTAVKTSYWDGAAWSAPTVLDAAYWAPEGRGTVIAAPGAGTWPTLGARPVGSRVRIEITAGGPADEQVRLYIKAVVAHWLNHPEAAQASAMTPNPLFERLLDRAAVY